MLDDDDDNNNILGNSRPFFVTCFRSTFLPGTPRSSRVHTSQMANGNHDTLVEDLGDLSGHIQRSHREKIVDQREFLSCASGVEV